MPKSITPSGPHARRGGRSPKGQFVKGRRSSPETEFKPGQHWRPHAVFREHGYLLREYILKERSTGEIAREHGVSEAAIIHWLRRHEIPRRSVSETRAIKHWGVSGEANPMYGRTGEASPNWKGGHTPERQAFYSSEEWRRVVPRVWKRDKATCQKCGKKARGKGRFDIHHVVSFAVAELRAELSNLVLLCYSCHKWVHSRKNATGEFIERG